MKLRNIVQTVFAQNAPSPLENLMECKFPAKKSYRLTKLYNKCMSEFKAYQTELNKMYEKYGTANSDGTYAFDKVAQELFAKELEELLDMEIEDILPVEVELTDDMTIAPKDMVLLEGVIEFIGLDEPKEGE